MNVGHGTASPAVSSRQLAPKIIKHTDMDCVARPIISASACVG